MEKSFWDQCWQNNEIGFHRQTPHPYLIDYFPRLECAAGASVLVPLCGKSPDLLWLRQQQAQVHGIEFNARAVADFFAENRLQPQSRPLGAFRSWEVEGLTLLQGDLFDLQSGDLGELRCVYDRAALVALPPAMRARYASRLAHLLPAGSRILLIANSYPAGEMQGPPFSVPAGDVARLFGKTFTIEQLASSERIGEHSGLRQRGLSSFLSSVYLLVKKG